jgi:membrane associated rhomboid family serine protease
VTETLSSDPAGSPVEVYRSHWRPACEERAFMLHAVGIGSMVVMAGGTWSIVVAADSADAARRQLRTYERENPPRRRLLPPEQSQPHALTGVVAYVAALLAFAWLAGHDAWGADWLASGVLDTRAFRDGEFWRAATAITLHFDVAHLLGNLGFGAFFGWLAAHLLGPGVAFGAGALAAVVANALNASFQPAQHVSAGASTMVFAMLGLLAAYAWRRRAAEGERWAYRWAPLVAGVILLGFTGAGGERTDVLAHLTGFVVGGVTGFGLAFARRAPGRAAQWLTGLGALAVVIASWSFALQ